jgi:hypothetical protein
MRRLPFIAGALALAWVALRLTAWMPPGFTRTVYAALGERGAAAVSTARDADLDFMSVPHGPRRFFSARWRGAWFVDRAGSYSVYLGADDWARLSIDGEAVSERSGTLGHGTVAVTRTLAEGWHTVDIQFEQEGGGAFLTTGWSQPGDALRPWANAVVFPAPVSATARFVNTAIRGVGWSAAVALAALVATWAVAAARRVRGAIAAGAWTWLAARERWLSAAGLVLVLALAGALRLDAVMVRYGPFDRPTWLAETEIHTRDRIEGWLRPHSFSWAKIPVPYVGGDPIGYLQFGREMTSFYAAHVREPIFPGAVHLWLRLVDDQDVAVSFASAFFSFLAVPATWWLGRLAYGPWVAFLASLGLAVDHDAVTWAADGWRDDTVLFFAVWVALGLLALWRRPSWPWAVALGVGAAGALLTRVTMLSLIVPGVLAVLWLGHGPFRARLRTTAIAAVVAAVLAGPYFYNCWRTFGDALYPINVHTGFYRFRAGESAPRPEPMSVGTYLRGRVARDPIGMVKTGAIGLFWFPFENKWVGFDYWYVGLRRFLMGMGAIGLVLMAATPQGRLLWVLLLGTLLPYAFTWGIPGGGEWRFTLPAYPFYLIAAALALVVTARSLPRAIQRLRGKIV